jgi:hypothetical protein
MIEALGALEATSLAVALRNSVWVYPLVNAAHVLGLALLVGAILPLDLRLLGCWGSIPLVPLWRVLAASAAIGAAVAALSGALLFSVRATEYVASPWFLGKLSAFGIGIVNAAALRRSCARRHWPHEGAAIPTRVKVAAGLSIAAWLTTVVLGRLVGYF